VGLVKLSCIAIYFLFIKYKMSGVAKFVKNLLAKAIKAASRVPKTLKVKKGGNRKTRRNCGLQRGG
jgi:ribosomal protein L39E